MGEPHCSSLVRHGRDKALLKPVFRLEATELFLRRELVAKTGRSRLFINELGFPGPLGELRPRMLLHTSRTGNALLTPEHHVEILDAFGDAMPSRSEHGPR